VIIDSSIKCHINSHELMKICLKLTDFICKYLKTNCIDKDLDPEERAPERIQNADTKRRGN